MFIYIYDENKELLHRIDLREEEEGSASPPDFFTFHIKIYDRMV